MQQRERYYLKGGVQFLLVDVHSTGKQRGESRSSLDVERAMNDAGSLCSLAFRSANIGRL